MRESTSELVAHWDGWGTALKPALEPITVARKPLSERTVAQNVLEHGTGGINIDGCRVALNGDYKCKANGRPSQTGLPDNYNPDNANKADTVGRFPANFIHNGSQEVLGLFPDTGKSTGGRTIKRSGRGNVGSGKASEKEWSSDDPGFGDSGSAARFFYCAKASKKDRDEGVGDIDDGRANSTYGSGFNSSTKIRTEEQKKTGVNRVRRKNNHPTVKPTDLMRYLCRLVTPPGGVVLDPFMGSGSTGKAALREGFRFIGVDLDPIDIAIARINRETGSVGYYAKQEQKESKREQGEFYESIKRYLSELPDFRFDTE